MSLLLIKDYWKEFLVLVLTVLSLVTITYLHGEVKATRSERDQYKQALDFQNASLLEQKAKYEVLLSELPKEITKIHTKYVPIYTNIDNFQKDENETDCDATKRFLNSVVY
jgi:hypothetical protein